MNRRSFRRLGLFLLLVAFTTAAPARVHAGSMPPQDALRIRPPQQVTLVLTADPNVISAGHCSILRWQVSPSDYELYLNSEPVMAQGEREVCPKVTAPYSLVVLTPEGPKTQTIVLRVGEGPVQRPPTPPGPSGAVSVQFLADPEAIPPGGCSDLRWNVTQGDWLVRLEGQNVPWVGAMTVCPKATRTYRLHVESPPELGGPRDSVVTVRVGAPPPPPPGPSGVIAVQFVADPEVIPPGGCSDLRWNVTQGDWAVRLEGQNVPWVGTLSVCPKATRSYRLRVEAPPDLGGPRDLTVTVQVGAVGPLTPAPPVAPKAPPAAPLVPSGADITPTDLFPDNQPHGQMWARITNDGPDTLVDKHVSVQGQANAFPPGSGNVAIPYLWSPAEYTLNLKPGETATLNLGWPVDNSTNRWEFRVTAKAKDFTDPNPGNDTYSESLAAVGGPPPGPPGPAPAQPVAPGSKTVDLAVTDLYPDKPQGSVWLRVTDNGPATLKKVNAEFKCGASGTPIGGGSPNWSHVEAPWTVKLTLKPGETKAIQTKIVVDLTQSTYSAFCAVRVLGGYTDPNISNDKYTETIAATGGPPAPGGGAVLTSTVPGSGGPAGKFTADVAPIDIFPRSMPKGGLNVRIANNGPDGLVDVPVTVKCVAQPHPYDPKLEAGPTSTSLQPHLTLLAYQNDAYATDLEIDTAHNWYDISCAVEPGSWDPKPGNNKYSEKIPPPP